MSEILFEITEDHLDTGLRGYPVGYCTTSYVDPDKGLFYVSKPVHEVCHMDPLEIIYLLLHKKFAEKEEWQAFAHSIEEMVLPKAFDQHLQALPKNANPMDTFCAALQLAGMLSSTQDYRKDCLHLIGTLPQIAAKVINHHAGWKEGALTKGYVERFFSLLGCPKEHTKHLLKVFKVFLILHLDHGGGNLSTFVGKAVASGLQHLHGSIVAAMNALAGSRHGKANQDSLEFIEMLLQRSGGVMSKENLQEFLEERMQKKQMIPGFGHAVLREEDPRATVFYDLAKEHFMDHPYTQTALLLREVGSKVLQETGKVADPHPNVDAITGSVLHVAGFPYPEYYTILFGLARCTGIAIQIIYERLEAKEGKGTPIVRPKYLFKKS